MWYSLLALEKIDKDAIVARVTVADNSPWFAGHFPGNPILPGIAQLHMVAGVVAFSRQESLYIHSLNRVKFKKLVRPGEPMQIHVATAGDDNRYSFRITQDNQDVCSGMMSLADKR
ncbi:MAG: hypothetical protein WBN83_15990 [Desulfoprunum sp.]|jgi:3-hydroxymyristoyl/3-hydroxydecanoyl-(acyl carrier protein) dehydratase|uniref:3-hydroxyacyl-ACP dehydratase FabZ family protein n=1 Tax=Desulfoprunum sp. TaxID=2020866 RepID=UPI000AFCD0D0